MLVFVCLPGCPGKYTGGGWIDSVAGPPDKATVGFNMHALDTDGDGFADDAKGQWQYHDHGADVAMHGEVTFALDLGGGVGYFGGTSRAATSRSTRRTSLKPAPTSA